MECRMLILFLLTTQTSTCVAELTGDNICPTVIRETVSLRVKVKEPVTIKAYTWCFKMPPRCSKYRVEMRDKYKIHHELRTRSVPACCPGYAPDSEHRLCAATCAGGCLRGACRSPDSCSCDPGYGGQRCDAECETGWFGSNCTKLCSCDNAATCNPETGDCRCTPGWRGNRCDVPCPRGNYGADCSLSCGCQESGGCNHVTGECDAVSTTPPEEHTSEAAAIHPGGDEGDTSETSARDLLETSEAPASESPLAGRSMRLPWREDHETMTQGDDIAEIPSTMVITSTQSIDHKSTDHMRLDGFQAESSSFRTGSSSSRDDGYSDDIVGILGKSFDVTGKPDVSKTSQYEEDLSEGSETARGTDDLQRLRQVTPTGETGDEPSGGGRAGDLLSTSCVSAGVAAALILTATLIVAAAHWRRSARKQAAAALFTYSGSAIPAHHVRGSQVTVSCDDSLPGDNHSIGTTSTLQSDEQKRSCDLRDSMTSHYDIPPPARLSLQADSKSPASEPIYEEIPGWGLRGASSSFLAFGGVLETSRV
ncbi:uncharacterized protein LOC134535565 [Bacillus rossius redtenbacheri]|uniref:uncharacterized protein LOC134535565 n=1 Tax=Bacillus rossius redtenbacheri TaxID=93214 RepID=UPI002FDE7636